MAKKPKRASRMETVRAVTEAVRRQNVAENSARDVEAQQENVKRIRRGPEPSAVARVLNAVRGFSGILDGSPVTRSVGTPGMAPVAPGESARIPVGGKAVRAVRSGLQTEGEAPDRPRTLAERLETVSKMLSPLPPGVLERAFMHPYVPPPPSESPVYKAARTIKRDVQTVGEARRKNAQEAKRVVSNAIGAVKRGVDAVNRYAAGTNVPTVAGPAIEPGEAARLGAGVIRDTAARGFRQAGDAVREADVPGKARSFANDVVQSAKEQWADPRKAVETLGGAIANSVKTNAGLVKDATTGVVEGLNNLAEIPYNIGAGISEGLGANKLLDSLGLGRKSAAEAVDARMAERKARNAERQAAAEAEERQRIADETARENLESTRLRNEHQRITNEARQTRHDLLKGRAAAENARNEQERAALAAQAAESRKQAEQTRVGTEGLRARMRGEREGKLAQEGLSAEDIQRRIGAIRQAYGRDISDEQWQTATGFSRDAGAIEAMGRADRKRYAQALDRISGQLERRREAADRRLAFEQRKREAQNRQRQIMEQRGHWSNGGYQSANKPIFAPNGMTAAQVDFSNRLKAQRIARETNATTRGQRAAYGRMLNDGTVTSMNIASFRGMGMQGDRLNQAIGATTGGQAYLNMRDAIAFQRDYMLKEAEMRGRRSAAAMGALGSNALSGGNPNNPGTQAAVDNVVNGTPPPTQVQTQAPQQREPGFNVQQQPQQENQELSSGEVADNWKREHGMTVA